MSRKWRLSGNNFDYDRKRRNKYKNPMKNILFLIILIASVLFCSCRQEEDQSKVVSLDATQSEKLVAGKVQKIIQLETTDASLLNDVSNVYIDSQNDRIFILSDFNIYVFNTQGKFIQKLKKGKGPVEVQMVIAFDVDPESKRLYVLDLAHTICIFNYAGEKLENRKLENFYSLDIHLLKDGNLFLYRNYVGESEKYFTGIYNFEENKVSRKFIHADESPYSIFCIGNANSFMQTDDQVYFYSSNLFGLYRFESDSFQKVISYDLGKRTVPESFLAKYVESRRRSAFHRDAKDAGYVPYLRRTFKFNGYYFVIIDDDKYSCYAIDEQKRNEVFMNGQLPSYFNLPEFESLRTPAGIQDDLMILSCAPLDFFENGIEEKTKQVELGGEKLEVNYDDNPILVLVK